MKCYKICRKCNAIMATGHIACGACGADVANESIWITGRIAIVCPTCKAKFTWAKWSRLPKCGDGTTDPELLEPGEEPETRRCRCGSTITVDLQDAAKRGLA